MTKYLRLGEMADIGKFGGRWLIAVVLMIFAVPTSSAAMFEVYINDSEELINSEDELLIESGNDLHLFIRVREDYRVESGNDEKAVASVYIDVGFPDNPTAVNSSGFPSLDDWKGRGEPDPNYDEFQSIFYGDQIGFEDYEGRIEFTIQLKNKNSTVIRTINLEITLEMPIVSDGKSTGFSLPGLPQPIQDNLMFIIAGLVVLIIVSFGIYTFVLAPEDTTAQLYKQKESVDPLSKSLTGVGYKSELPSESKLKRLEHSKTDSEEEEEEEEEFEDYDDDGEDEEFDESELLAALTGGQALKKEKKPAQEVAAAPKAKKVVKRKVAKKVTRKVAPPATTSKEDAAPKKAAKKAPSKKPEVFMGEDVVDVTCPSCEKTHHIDKHTSKFICGCGRRIRV